DLETELLQDAADLCHLVGVALCKRPLADPQAVLEAHANVAAHDRRHGRDVHLVAAGAEDRPEGGGAEEAGRGGAPGQGTPAGGGPIPPRMPKTDWMNSGGLRSLRSRKCAAV